MWWLNDTNISTFDGTSIAAFTVPKTITAISEASVSFSCRDRSCDAAGVPYIEWIEGCKGDADDDPVRVSKWYRRARACALEGGTRITIHGNFLAHANITVGGEPCRDAEYNPSNV